MSPRISLVVAVADNGVIGKDGTLPWRMRDDLKWFKSVTTGKPIVMGRTTWESLGGPLPQRRNIVVSRQLDNAPEGSEVFAELDEALTAAAGSGVDEICLIGGAQLYTAAMARADRLYVTRVHGTPEGDTLFTLPDETGWTRTILRRIEKGSHNDFDATVEQWDRKA